MTVRPQRRIVRFDVFEVDLGTGDVRNNGHRLKLRGQPLKVLAMLVERPGEPVTREELRNRLWPADTFVDFDHSLNTSINKLRDVLADSATHPRFVETLPRIGYRFIAPVHSSASNKTSVPALRSGQRLLQWGQSMGWVFSLCAALLLVGVLIYGWTASSRPLQVGGYSRLSNDARHKERLVSDGARLYMMEEFGGNFAIRQLPATGGDTTDVAISIANVGLVSVIPGGAGLLAVERNGIQLDGPLWRLPLPGGTARRVGAIIAHDATESNDHADILYARANDLFITDEQGLNTRKLATVAGWAWRPHFAPDKQTLRFTLFDAASNSLSLWEMKADGSNLHELLRGWNRPAQECCGDWTPDGRYFFFASETKGKSDIWLLQQPRLFHTGNRQPVRLTSGPMNFSDPVAAADGRTLFVLGRTERTELSRYDARTRAFVPYFGGVSADGIDFSRDGNWIAWTSYPDNSLWRSKADGSQKLQLTSAPLEAHLPQWSPDGKEIVFIGKAPGEALKICVVSASDGSLRRLTSGPQNDAAPTWSRDGKWIAFAGAPWLEGGPSNNYVIRLLNVSTHETSVLPGSAGLFAPRISPDGAYLAALTVDATKLMLFSFRTQKWTELAAPGFGMLSPVWSHDSRYVYFNNLNFRRDPAVFRIGVAERKFERVAAFRGLLRVALGNWAPFSALAPDDSVLVLRDVGSEEVYALELQ